MPDDVNLDLVIRLAHAVVKGPEPRVPVTTMLKAFAQAVIFLDEQVKILENGGTANKPTT